MVINEVISEPQQGELSCMSSTCPESGLHNLEAVELSHSVTAPAVQELRKALPSCKISTESGSGKIGGTRSNVRLGLERSSAARCCLGGRQSLVLSAAMGALLLEIHHIGSTAIPGIRAKPVIDILAVVSDIARLDEASPRWEALGYESMGEFGIPGRRYFRKDDAAGKRTHQIHAFQTGSPQIDRHLAFRDFLRAHPEDAIRYEALKLRLAELHPEDIEAYASRKDEFVKEVVARAGAWRKSKG
jgi:GrpB-like predicted nucleotidyltransferase (UPF0157 family)